MAISIDKIETAEAWCSGIEYKIDILLRILKTKDPVKRKKLEAFYRKAERVTDRLAKQLCQN